MNKRVVSSRPPIHTEPRMSGLDLGQVNLIWRSLLQDSSRLGSLRLTRGIAEMKRCVWSASTPCRQVGQ